MSENKTNQDNVTLSTWWRKYRIVKDGCLGFEAQVKWIWWPFWIEIDFCNSSSSIEEATKIAEKHAKPIAKYI